MDDDFFTPEMNAYVRRANESRGEILNNTILLERVMDEFISMAFADTKERQRELYDIIISEGLNYNNKVKVVLKIIRKHIPDDKARHKKIGSLEKDLKDIAAIRNAFAHEVMRLDIENEQFALFNIILFNFRKNALTLYTEEDIAKDVRFILKHVDIIKKLREDFWGTATP